MPNQGHSRPLFLILLLSSLLVALLGAACAAPQATLAPLAPGTDVALSLSRPSNGSYFATGERVAVAVTLKGSKADFATLGLYAYGPQETTKTVTAAKLLNASTDRSKTPHHYIDLLTDTTVQVEGSTLRYTFQPVSNEEAGTYTVALRAVKKGDPPVNQAFVLADFQLGTATVEKQIVEKENCAACHQGAANGQFYFAHVDPSARSSYGSPSIDSIPVRTCKACHNNEGYAAYRGDIANPAAGADVRTPDPIVRRVHGVHMGEELKNTFNTDPTTGNFRDYTGVIFPANVKNCTTCHTDDRWKTQPSRLACGACHDNMWFGETASMPKTFEGHKGGPQANDANCAGCHQAEGTAKPSIAGSHKVEPPAFKHKVELTMSAPPNGKFYVGGEKPRVTITVKDATTGAIIDPNTMVGPADATKPQANEFRRGNLFVSGPRDETQPVLTAAAPEVGPTANTYASNDFRVLTDATKMDPRFTRTATSITYQLDDVKDLKPGTYTVWVETLPGPMGTLGGWALLNFQVGTETPDKKVATNCTQCHGDTRMHAAYFAVQFNPDICKSCHDYKRQIEGQSGWTNRNNGYGAAPLSRRVHGVHFGRYLDKPKEVHATYDFSEVIFPQDIRNCTKCHDPQGSPAWKENPSRLACLACHDSAEARTHAKVNMQDPTPADPYGGDETETCVVCHGKGREFSPDKVHNISNPYKPPYPREPE